MKRRRKSVVDKCGEQYEEGKRKKTSSCFTERLSDEFFQNVSCVELAKKLLGSFLCRRIVETGEVLRGRIVETEAYLGVEDAGSQSYKGKITPRNEPMFMKPGTLYVYFTYGMYHMLNVSSEGEGAAVLFRALEPIHGVETMTKFRKAFHKKSNGVEIAEKKLCNGPAKLNVALNIDKNTINKQDITTSDVIWLEKGDPVNDDEIVITSRIVIL